MTLLEFAKLHAELQLIVFVVVCILAAIGWVAFALASRADRRPTDEDE